MDIISGNPEENALAIEATGAIRQVIDFILDKDTFLIKQLRGSLSSDERADIIRQRQQLNDL